MQLLRMHVLPIVGDTPLAQVKPSHWPSRFAAIATKTCHPTAIRGV